MEKEHTCNREKAMCIYTVVLEGMEFFAYHGCREDEKTDGNTFMADLRASYESEAGITDNLADAVNYGEIYRVVAAQMAVRSNLLENLAWRIMEALKRDFPQLTDITLTVSKKNPPVNGPCSWSRIEMKWKKDE